MTQTGFTHERGYQGETNVWLTPPEIIKDLGPFDLDPCASVGQPWPTAAKQFTIQHDGLSQPWEGFVWCNPPYGPHTTDWLEKLAAHPGGGIALVFARTETTSFFKSVWPKFTAMLFLKGRIRFFRPDGTRGESAGSPSVLIAYGSYAAERLFRSTIKGFYLERPK